MVEDADVADDPQLDDRRRLVEHIKSVLASPDCTFALDQHIAKKPAGLIQAQRESFQRMHERLLELGWPPDRLVVNPESGCISVPDTDGPLVLFLQAVQDQMVRETFRVYRAELPKGLHIQQLPLDHVGALATLDAQGYAGFSPDGTGDFVGISSGVMKLGLWALAVAKSVGQQLGRVGQTDSSGVKELPKEWWQEALLPLAFDILGCTIDPVRVATIAAYDATASESAATQQTISTLMKAFVVFHEIGHHERGHGWLRRAWGLDKQPESQQCWFMEAEADRFAIEHVVELADPHAAASSASLLFLLFAMSPDLLDAYPWCHDESTHPHPLTRLVWLLRELYPEDLTRQAKHMDFVIKVLVQSGPWQEKADDMEMAIRYVLLTKESPPDGF